MPPHYRVLTSDTFRHVAEAYGDDNPLWCDPSYATQTRWNGPLAPPPLVGGDTLIGEDEVTEDSRCGQDRCRAAKSGHDVTPRYRRATIQEVYLLSY